MFKYVNKLLDDAKIYTYNYFNHDHTKNSNNVIYKTFADIEDCVNTDKPIDDKQLRIDTLLFVRQFKNTYYKYTNKEKFNQELYNSFIDDHHFDGGNTGYDDDDDVRIFDRYILEYIKNRSDVVTFLVCKNKEIIYKTKLEDLSDIANIKGTHIDILFTIDMNEKDLFHYCYSNMQGGQISMIKPIVFSLICKYKGEFVRIKISTFNANKKNHPYLILESFLVS